MLLHVAMNLQPHDRCAKAMDGMNANNVHGITSDTYNTMIMLHAGQVGCHTTDGGMLEGPRQYSKDTG